MDGGLPGEFFPLLQQPVERSAFNQLHSVEVLIPLTNTSEAAHDVGVSQGVEDFKFPLESREDSLVGDVGRKELDGDVSIVDDVTGSIDDAHTPFAQLVQKLEGPNPLFLHGRTSENGKKGQSVLLASGVKRPTSALALSRPSTAAETIPPAKPAPSPAG